MTPAHFQQAYFKMGQMSSAGLESVRGFERHQPHVLHRRRLRKRPRCLQTWKRRPQPATSCWTPGVNLIKSLISANEVPGLS
jgi:hypothetical protein